MTPKELDRLTAHARKNNWDKAAEHYKKVYGLCVRADEKVILDTYFLNKLASCITRTEQELDSLKPADFSDGSALFGTYLTPLTGAPDVACDIKWNTGNNLPDDWPKFCRHYLNRNFAGARTESHVQKEPLRRRWWKNRCMNQSIIKQIKYQHQRTAKLLNNNK